MAVVASIDDREDGTGADVTLDVGIDSADVTVYVARYTGAWDELAFATAGTNTSSSEIALPLATLGSYVAAFVHSGVPAGVFGFRVTDGENALHVRCLNAIRDHVVALALPGFPAEEKHVIHTRPRYSLRELGGDPSDYIGVHYWPLEERRTVADNVRDEVIYPVQIAFVRGNGGGLAIDNDWFLAREILSKSFPGCPLPAVYDINEVRVVPAAINDPSGASLNLDLQSLIFDCHTQQPRQVV